MNLDELKQSWDKLSERLEREELLRREELRMIVESKVTSYNNRIKEAKMSSPTISGRAMESGKKIKKR